MNTLVVYDSQFGNTERIAQVIADTLRAFGSGTGCPRRSSTSSRVPGGGPAHSGVPNTGISANPGNAVLSRKHLKPIADTNPHSKYLH